MRNSGGILGERLTIEAEMARERTSALRRVTQGLELYLRELETLEAALTQAHLSEQPRIRARHEEVRELAKQQLWYLVVQREAMGLNNHEVVYEVYKVPKSLTV